MESSATLLDIATPALILEEDRFRRNVARVHAAVARHAGVALRPHFKTGKSMEALERSFLANRRACVSTIAEARFLHDRGVRDLLYAVGISRAKLAEVARLRALGTQLTVVLDSVAAARALAQWAQSDRTPDGAGLSVMIEIDSDGHRAGVTADGEALIDIATILRLSPGIELAGVMTHAGAAYDCLTTDEIVRMAETERRAAVTAANRLVAAGIPCRDVSVGSTPTVLFAEHLDGVTEARVGVGYFNDLTMVGLGVCNLEEVAVSVLATVIGHQPGRNCLIVDAGWAALSPDRSSASQRVFAGYGLVTDLHGCALPGTGVLDVNQEHGLIGAAPGTTLALERFPIGSRLRVLPNHACATAAAHAWFTVIDSGGSPAARWLRCSGW